MEKRTLQQHINDTIVELDSATTSRQRKRHLEFELEQLEKYQHNNPEKTEDPTSLELFCDENPDAPECLIYEV
jgi:hypothetical protein